jgi:hypothetical protein
MMATSDDFEEIARHLRALADDLDRLAAGHAPDEAELAAVPVLHGWKPELSENHEPAVSGIVSGDPFHADGEAIRIEIVAADDDLAWVRGLLGWYRLGVPQSELAGHGEDRQGAQA